MNWHDLFDDGEVLGAVVTCLLIIIPLVIGPHLEKWWGKKDTPQSDQGE